MKGERAYAIGGFDEGNDKSTYKMVPGFGIASGLGLLIKLSDTFGMKFECAPTFAYARVKEITIEDRNGNKETYIYLKNEENLPDGTSNTIYRHGGPTYSLSSVSAKVGILFDF